MSRNAAPDAARAVSICFISGGPGLVASMPEIIRDDRAHRCAARAFTEEFLDHQNVLHEVLEASLP